MSKTWNIRLALTLFFLGLTLVFGLAYYFEYFRWRDCFNPLGRCLDAETGTIILQQSGITWAMLTLLSGAISAYHLYKLAGLQSRG